MRKGFYHKEHEGTKLANLGKCDQYSQIIDAVKATVDKFGKIDVNFFQAVPSDI